MLAIEQNLFTLFAVIIVGFLALDLGYFNRKSHRISPKEAIIQSLFWVGISLGFAVLILIYMNGDMAAQFLTAYVTEKMLSVDNLFVIALIFSYFKLEDKYHHKVLFWGIIGAIVFRAIFIGLGSEIIKNYSWVLYIFGAILIYTGIKLLKDKKEEHMDLSKNRTLRLAQKYLPLTTEEHHGKFLIKKHDGWKFTTLFLVILMVESTDIIFAIDSIPAAFSVSRDPFIVFTSNIFAVMGLRALFFLLENVLHKFHHLQKALAFILIFIGGKMLLEIFHIKIPSLTSFVIIMAALGLAVGLSLKYPKKF